jgi:protein TonB
VESATLPASSFVRRRQLPALALPRAREDRRTSAVLSVALHVLVVMLLITPFAVHHAIVEQPQGAGGDGPAGGGGGGHGGTGGVPEEHDRLQFIRVAAPPATEIPTSPVVAPPPTPVPPPEPVKVEPIPEAKIEVAAPAKVPDVAATPGVGGGSGHDGTNGTGPGTGGGVGTGIGTGRGSGIGPGTGGGNQVNYPPQPIEFFLPPLPAPDRVRGFHLVAEFDVDESGRVRAFDFTPTRDGDYNKRLQEVLRNLRFRAGTRPDGTPIRMKAQIGYDF